MKRFNGLLIANKRPLRVSSPILLFMIFILGACAPEVAQETQGELGSIVTQDQEEVVGAADSGGEAVVDESSDTVRPVGGTNLELEMDQNVSESTLPTAIPPLEEGAWMDLPIIPEISVRALEIYAEGIKMGNDPNSFSKVGDCQNVPSMFVSIFDHAGFYTLGEENAYLAETIEWYQGSFKHESEAVRRGFNAASVVSPVWADPEVCEIGEDPLGCELRIHNPSVAIVSLETWWAGNPDNYEKYVRQILETLIDNGVLPILATKADNLEGDHHINTILAGLANEYQIPLWNFWLAVQPLPNHGLMEDEFHLTFAPNEFNDPLMMESAWPWRNLTALQMLHAVRTAVKAAE
jgi:hypothetical protein